MPLTYNVWIIQNDFVYLVLNKNIMIIELGDIKLEVLYNFDRVYNDDGYLVYSSDNIGVFEYEYDENNEQTSYKKTIGWLTEHRGEGDRLIYKNDGEKEYFYSYDENGLCNNVTTLPVNIEQVWKIGSEEVRLIDGEYYYEGVLCKVI